MTIYDALHRRQIVMLKVLIVILVLGSGYWEMEAASWPRVSVQMFVNLRGSLSMGPVASYFSSPVVPMILPLLLIELISMTLPPLALASLSRMSRRGYWVLLQRQALRNTTRIVVWLIVGVVMLVLITQPGLLDSMNIMFFFLWSAGCAVIQWLMLMLLIQVWQLCLVWLRSLYAAMIPTLAICLMLSFVPMLPGLSWLNFLSLNDDLLNAMYAASRANYFMVAPSALQTLIVHTGIFSMVCGGLAICGWYAWRKRDWLGRL